MLLGTWSKVNESHDLRCGGPAVACTAAVVAIEAKVEEMASQEVSAAAAAVYL